MKKINIFLILALMALFIHISLNPAAVEAAGKKLNIVTSMSLFEEAAREIGGEHVNVSNLGPHDQDLHFVLIKPSHINLLINADVIVHTGLMGEPWLPALLESASNRNLMPGNPGDCDTSVGIKILEKPATVSREMGDVHPAGNPHFWLDPVNIIIIGSNIKNKLSSLDPAHKADFEKNFAAFSDKWKKLTLGWAKRLDAVRPVKTIDYHVSWSYFYERFKIEHICTIEPKPGIKPSGAHLAGVIAKGKEQKVDCMIAEPFFPQKDINMVANELKVPFFVVQQTPGGKLKKMEDVFEVLIAFLESVKKKESK
ncbi:MAG: hypothetical protein A2008_03605 [Candidatus Wallbacteria bacterium GWC2_49_35]|uniref:ABC transporter substrate-binding protein n=1 Tax=Candidatus Wallbacteria bacterium GWC2_49_35 TaxID=1817813 RepID=A0A1F7X0B0_9BACT|nr:MAG: hypothetical protein A2008_03605 [Candidatus Wallbacteria bacterium GWC2_49_35]HBC74282.1 hypothetical protein [Candidatus Wallbacteria bacterium]